MFLTIEDVVTSEWATRAWTYQESLVARKRLYFTDRQLYFESDEFFRTEYTYGPPGMPGMLPQIDMGQVHARLASKLKPSRTLTDITVYNRRRLTFPYDILNAFLGYWLFMSTKQVFAITGMYHIRLAHHPRSKNKLLKTYCYF